MDNKSAKKSPSGVTPAKLVLVGVLAVILLGVLYIQFAPSGSDRGAARATSAARKRPAARKPATRPTASAPSAPTAKGLRKMGNLNRWQNPELAAVTRYDPFALPAAFPQPRPADEPSALAQDQSIAEDPAAEKAALEDLRTQMKQRLDAMRHQGVHVIVKSHDEFVAVIGDKEIRVGDEINGFTVVAINSNGVQVAWERNE